MSGAAPGAGRRAIPGAAPGSDAAVGPTGQREPEQTRRPPRTRRQSTSSRRNFLGGAAAAMVGLLLGREGSVLAFVGQTPTPVERTPGSRLEASTFVRRVPFEAEPPEPLGQRLFDGLDARLYTDLALATVDRRIPNRQFFVRTGAPPGLGNASLDPIRLTGLVEDDVGVDLATLRSETQDLGEHVLECAGNNRALRFGLLSSAAWSGVPLADVLERARPASSAVAVLVEGFDAHARPSTTSGAGCSWTFRPEEIEDTGAFLALEMNGEPLSPDHGSPVRLVVPGWYGCCSVKWVREVRFVGEDESATAHMKEFALRTHQGSVPELARDYEPAVVDRTALPVSVELHRVGGRARYLVAGLEWGADRNRSRLLIRFRPGDPWTAVERPAAPPAATGWGVWTHEWQPPGPGPYLIQLRVEDTSIRAFRLDGGLYIRAVQIEEA